MVKIGMRYCDCLNWLHLDIVDNQHFCFQVVLVVNVATYWGLTFQYNELNALHTAYDDLEVLAFPCNQFGLVR